MPNDSKISLIIRRLQEKDRSGLMEFYRIHHQHRPRLLNETLWQWEFLKNPGSSNTQIPFFIIECDEKIKGTIGAIPFSIQLENNVLQGCHPVNYFVAPEFKGLPALRLLRAVLAEYPVSLTSYVSDDAAKLCKAARFMDLSNYLHDYFFFFESSSKAFSTSRLKTVVMTILRNSWAMSARHYYRMLTGRSVQCQISNTLIKDCIPAINSQNEQLISIIKTPDYLQWRYEDSPMLNCVFVSITKNSVPLLLAVLHIESSQRKAVILDVVGTPTKTKYLGLLITEIIHFCRNKNIKILTTTFLNIKLASLFRRLGFGRAVSGYRFMVYTNNKTIEQKLASSRNWNFMIGDTDLY